MFNIIKLPILEPLTSEKINKLSDLSLSILYCAINHTAASSIISLGQLVTPKCTVSVQPNTKEDELEASAAELVEECLALFGFIGNVFKLSVRAGGNVSII